MLCKNNYTRHTHRVGWRKEKAKQKTDSHKIQERGKNLIIFYVCICLWTAFLVSTNAQRFILSILSHWRVNITRWNNRRAMFLSISQTHSNYSRCKCTYILGWSTIVPLGWNAFDFVRTFSFYFLSSSLSTRQDKSDTAFSLSIFFIDLFFVLAKRGALKFCHPMSFIV